MERRKGRQTPTQSFVIPYTETKGGEAVEIYNRSPRTAQEWQELLLYDIMATDDDGLWTHSRFGYSVPRRNGKNEIALMREAWGIINGEKIMHTAHRTTTSHSAWERLIDLLVKAGYKEGEDFKTHKQYGLEDIIWTHGDGRVNFRTRSAKGGLGEGYDLILIDEAQEYTTDQESALKYVVTDSMNPQTIFCGTPPTAVSGGTVFQKMRRNVLGGNAKNSGWAEWSVPFLSDCNDRELWYETNPSLGTVFTERAVSDEVGTDEQDFNIQRLGLWLQYNLKSAISKTEWRELQTEELPTLTGDLFAGVKFGRDGKNVALSVAVKTTDGVIFVETIDCRNVRDGVAWLIDWLGSMRPKKIVIDGASGQGILSEALKDARIKGETIPTVGQIITANAKFEQALFSKTICHMEQPSVEQIVSNCDKRAIGSGGGFGYMALRDGMEIAILDSIILAHWACAEDKGKPTTRQKVGY